MPNQSSSWVAELAPRSEIAELLLAPDDRTGRAYISYTLGNGARLLIPKQGAARRGGLAIYNPQLATGLAAKGLMWTGIWPGHAVGLRPEPLEELRQILAACIGNSEIELAFQFGVAGIYSKTIVLVMDFAGTPLGYAKLAAITSAQEAVRHEAAVLDRLSRDARLRGRVPCLRGALEWRGFPLLVTSAGPTHRAPLVFGAAHQSFLVCLGDSTRTTAVLAESPMWQGMNNLRVVWSDRLSAAWRARYDWALRELEQRLGRARLDLALAHRDLAPWNTRLNSDGTLFVFDWEFARAGSTPGWDFFHFHVALRVARARPLDADAVSELLLAARWQGIEPAEEFLLACLTDMALFHHNAMLRQGNENHRLLATAAQGIDTLRRLRF